MAEPSLPSTCSEHLHEPTVGQNLLTQNLLDNKILKASLVAQSVKNLPATWETRIQFLGHEDPLEKEMATPCSILAWRIPQTRSLAGYSPWGPKSQTRLSD